MKYHKNLCVCVLKIIILTGFIFLNTSKTYGQDEREDAKISLSYIDEGDIKSIKATVTDKMGLPVEELDLYFYVKRNFGLLPIGDVFNTTDENGEVEVKFPNDLPGDVEGNVKIVVKILESDVYNDVTVVTIKKWGKPIAVEHHELNKRSLWAAAANAPMSLIISVSIMIISVWYIIFYIIFKLYKISKIKPIKL